MDLTEKTLSREEKYSGTALQRTHRSGAFAQWTNLLSGSGGTCGRRRRAGAGRAEQCPDRASVPLCLWADAAGTAAGKLDPGEDPVTGALRELKEETGAVPDTFLPLGRILPAPGCYSEVLHLFLARNLHMGEQHLDPGEFLHVERIPFDEMVHRCLDGEIEDAKTVAAVLKAKVQLNL